MVPMYRVLIPLLAVAGVATACSSSSSSDSVAAPQVSDAQDSAAGIRLVSVADAAAIQANPPENLVILDVRTPEEFAEGHLAGAVMIDFYDTDFVDRLDELDPAVPYLVYCRSGSRSGQTTALMKDLGFADVADVDGGILAWTEAGQATTKG